MDIHGGKVDIVWVIWFEVIAFHCEIPDIRLVVYLQEVEKLRNGQVSLVVTTAVYAVNIHTAYSRMVEGEQDFLILGCRGSNQGEWCKVKSKAKGKKNFFHFTFFNLFWVKSLWG
jgi:hypothetical protein